MFRKPPSKLEQLQSSISQSLEALQDTLESLPLDRAKEARDQAASTVSHGWEAALHRAGDAIHVAADTLGSVASTVATRTAPAAQYVRDNAPGVAQSVAGSATDIAGRVAESAQANARDIAAKAGTVAAAVAARAAKTAERTGHSAQDAAEHAAAIAHERAAQAAHSAAEARDCWFDILHKKEKKALKLAEQAQQEAKEAAGRAIWQARRKAAEVKQTHVVVEDTTSKWLWIGVGLLAGATLAIFLAPTSGRRSRALVKDKLNKAKHQAAGLGGAAVSKANDLTNRAQGAVAEHKASGEDDADDVTIADRVRTALGEHETTRDLERLNVDSFQGVVTLRGPISNPELQALIVKIVEGVKGVKEVHNALLVEEAKED